MVPINMYIDNKNFFILLNRIPDWLTNGISVGGALMPTVGFALLLVMIIKQEGWAWFMIGFILAAVLNMNAITIAIAACASAVLISVPKLSAIDGKKTDRSELLGALST